MKQSMYYSLIAALLLAAAAGTGCKRELATAGNSLAAVQNFSHSDCKPRAATSAPRAAAAEAGEYIRFQAAGARHLAVQHVNAMFNCCPGELLANVAIRGDTITINHSETQHSCNCICPYDLQYTLGPLEHGSYHVVLKVMDILNAEFDLVLDEQTDVTIKLSKQREQ